jgi:hypothetical protein
MGIYTSFSYKIGNCGKVTEAILIDEWLLEENDRFSRNADLYPSKTPDDFMGCQSSLDKLHRRQ